MSIANLFHYTYYLDQNLPATFSGFWVVVTVLALIIIGSGVLSVNAGKWAYFKRMVAVRITRMGFIVGWFGLAWMFFRFESIPYFSMRIWPLLLFIYVLFELGYLIKWIKVDYPKKKTSKAKNRDKDLYLRKYLGK